MSADKIKGPIVIFTKAKKNSHAPQGLELLDLSWELPTGFTIPEHANKAATQKKMNNDEKGICLANVSTLVPFSI